MIRVHFQEWEILKNSDKKKYYLRVKFNNIVSKHTWTIRTQKAGKGARRAQYTLMMDNSSLEDRTKAMEALQHKFGKFYIVEKTPAAEYWRVKE